MSSTNVNEPLGLVPEKPPSNQGSKPVSPRQTKQQKKKQEEQKRLEAERLAEIEKQEREKKEKEEQEELDAFRNKNRIKLDFLHAFGNYTGPEDYDIEDQICMVKDKFGTFKRDKRSSMPQSDAIGSINQAIHDPIKQENAQSKANDQSYFKGYSLLYPVGRHLAMKCLETNLMKFCMLPVDSKEVTCITYNDKRTMIAIAVKSWVFEGYHTNHLTVLFYSIEAGVFKRLKQYTIKATKGAKPVIPCFVSNKEKLKTGGTQMIDTVFERYVSSMSFSKDDKYFSLCIRNGPKQCVIQTYDMFIKGQRLCTSTFDFIVKKIKYMPRDNQKLVIAGENTFNFFSTSMKQLTKQPDFENMPINPLANNENPQVFTAFCYRENDHLVGCSDSGEIFIIEVMDVIQVIDSQSLILPGTDVRSRLNFKHIASNKFGFVVASPDVVYFFQFKPNKQGSGIKGKGTYHCVLKWRASEFQNNTHITSISVCETHDEKTPEDANIAITTKNNQIIYMNLYKQVYYPDHLKLIKEMKSKSGEAGASDESSENSDDQTMSGPQSKIKCVGIQEEDLYADEAQKAAKNLTAEGKKQAAKRENQALIDEIRYFTVASGFHQGEISCLDICIQRPIIATLSKGDSTIRVWNYDTGECELIKSYSNLQKEFQSTNQTYLQSIALHPSGFYMAISFIDKVRVYHLMQSEIREYRTLDLKNCHTVKFSNGGQLLICIDFKEISIYNAYQLDKPRKMQTPSSLIKNIDFNHNDTIMIVVSKDGFVQKYDLVKAQKTGDSVINKVCNFNDVCFSQIDRAIDPNDISGQRQLEALVKQGFDVRFEEKFFVVGSHDCQKMMIRCYNEQDIDCQIEVASPYGANRFTGIVDIKGPLAGQDMEIYEMQKRARNLIMSLDNGRLYLYGMQPNLKVGREVDVVNTHHGAINVLKKTHDNQIVVSGGDDGTIFIYRVSEIANSNVGKFSRRTQELAEKLVRDEREMKKLQEQSQSNQPMISESKKDDATQQEDVKAGEDPAAAAKKQAAAADSGTDSDEDNNVPSHKLIGPAAVIDQRLSNIVLIEKQQMDKWRQQQEELKLDMEKENNQVESSLRREKYNYETKIATMERKKSDRLNDLNRQYDELQQQEAEEKDENTQTMKKMELNHSGCMEELHSLFEKKLQMEKQQYDKLKSDKEELKGNFKQEIKELTTLNEQAIEKLLNDFKDELQKVQDEYDKSKRTADGYKMIYEERLTQTEDDNTGEIKVQEEVNDREIQQLIDVIDTIKEDIETIKRGAKREQDESANFKKIAEKARKKKEFRKKVMDEKVQEIAQLDQEKKEIQDKLKKKEEELYQYKFKIMDLQRTKQVLTHRTQEMKASLEPKEQQIENLKEQLLDLEKVFNQQLTALDNLEKDVKKKEDKIKEMQQKVFNEKIRTKKREDTISKFVNKVQMASFTSKDDEDYKKAIMEIYTLFVREHMTDILENKKKDPETIEELGRKKQYLAKSKATLESSTAINEAKTKVNINKRRRENNSLIKDLESVRSSKKDLEKRLENKQLEIQKKKLESQKKQREFDKKLNEIENETLAKVRQAQMANKNAQRSDTLGGPDPESEQIYKRMNSKDAGGGFFSNEQGVPSKVKGKLYKGTLCGRGNTEDKKKIGELVGQIEENKQQILLQKLEKRSLQEQIIRLLDERADDLGLSEEEKRAQLSKLNIQPFGNEDMENRNQTFGLDGTQEFLTQNQDIN